MKRIVLLGTGHVAYHLAQGIAALEGFVLVQIYGRRPEAVQSLLQALPYSSAVAYSLDDLDPCADYYLFALSDRALPEVWRAMPPTRGLWVHTAGSVPLEAMLAHHHSCGVLYPLQTFSRTRPLDWRDLPLYIEGSTPESYAALEALAIALSGRVAYADSEARGRLHLGAVLACNFTNHLIALAEEYLHAEGLEPKVLLPLVSEMVAKLHTMPALEAQTGPALRDDRPTIDRHLALLEARPDLQTLYRLLSESIRATHQSST